MKKESTYYEYEEPLLLLIEIQPEQWIATSAGGEDYEEIELP